MSYVGSIKLGPVCQWSWHRGVASVHSMIVNPALPVTSVLILGRLTRLAIISKSCQFPSLHCIGSQRPTRDMTALYVLIVLMLLVDKEQLPGAIGLDRFDLYLSITWHQEVMSTSCLYIHVRRALNKVYLLVVKLMVLVYNL